MYKRLVICFLTVIFLLHLIFANDIIDERNSELFFESFSNITSFFSTLLGYMMLFVMIFAGIRFSYATDIEQKNKAKNMLIYAGIGFILFIVLPIFLELPFSINQTLSEELYQD